MSAATGNQLINLNTTNFSDGTLWQVDNNAADQSTAVASNFSAALASTVGGKYFVLEPVSVATPIISYENEGNLIAEQIAQVQSWIISHSTDAAAVARYQVQLSTLETQLVQLGLGTVTAGGGIIAKQSVDVLAINIPNLYAAPGSIFITSDAGPAAYANMVGSGVGKQLTPRADAQVTILNDSPFQMLVNDAVVEDSKVVMTVNGQYTVFQPGNVWVNSQQSGPAAATSSTNQITIDQIDLSWDTTGLPATISGGTLPQDVYILGSVNDQGGDININNLLGDVNVSGQLNGLAVNINSGGQFNLNIQGWEHTGGDPTQWENGFSAEQSSVFNAYNASTDAATPTLDQHYPP